MKKSLQTSVLSLVLMFSIISIGTVANAADVNPLCPVAGEMTFAEFGSALTSGSVSYTFDVSTDTGLATVVVNNTTGCKIPLSLSVYSMFDQVLSHQEFFDGSGLVDVSASPSTTFTSKLPICMAQIDLWYGLAPQTLSDSANYADGTNPPTVFAWKYIHNNKDSYQYAAGDFCQHPIPPTIDVCSNIEGNQSIIPEGMTESGGICTTPPPISNGGNSGNSGGSGSGSSGGGSGYIQSSGNGINGEVLGAQTSVAPVELVPQVLGAEIGFPQTGNGGNTASNIIMLVTSGSIVILGAIYFVRKYGVVK